MTVDLASGRLTKRMGLSVSPSRDMRALLVILLTWLVTLILINPVGDFPINDDWAYAASVKALVEHGDIIYSNWTSANLVSQIAWGALFALPFGASYTVLRFTTELLAILAAGTLYLTLRKCKCSPGIALSGTLVFLFNPLIFVMSASFMSDVPYTAMQVIAMLFLIGGLQTQSKWGLCMGWGVAGLALLCRQVGLAIPLGFGVARLARTHYGWRSIVIATMPFVAFVIIQIFYQKVLIYWHIMPADFARPISISYIYGSDFGRLADAVLRFGVKCAYYFGWFLLPISLQVVAHFTRSVPRVCAILIWTSLCAMAVILAWLGPVMPVWAHGIVGSGNIIKSGSLGGADIEGVPPPYFFWPAVTILSTFGILTLLLALALNCATLAREIRTISGVSALFAAATALALLGSVALLRTSIQFDRYIIPVIPCLIIFLCMRLRTPTVVERPIPGWARVVGGTIFAAMAGYSVLGTHDFLEEKRTQWIALQDLVQKGHISPEIIDADWVYNAPVSFGLYGNPNDMHSWFRSREFVVESSRTLEANDRKTFSLIRSYPVKRWAPWSQAPGDIVVMHRAPKRG